MEVAVEQELFAIGVGLQEVFEVVDWRMEVGKRELPAPVEVDTCERGSVVSADHAVRVEDWEDFEDVHMEERGDHWDVV